MNICLLGNAGCGKTLAASMMSQYINAKIVESDDLAHDAYLPGTAGWKAVTEHFGGTVMALDNSIDRGKLGEIIFTTPGEREFLQSVVDPYVRERVRQEFVDGPRMADTSQHGVLVSYLMVERRWFPDAFHHAVVISCNPGTCVQRLSTERGWSELYANAVLAAQLSADEVAEQARAIFGSRVTFISNDGDVAELERAIREFLYSLLATTGSEDQIRWAGFLENESTHLLSIFIAEQQRASWLLAVSGALLGVVVANKPATATAPISAFTLSIGFLVVAVLFSLFSVYPVDGYKHLYGDLLGFKYRRTRSMPIDEFVRRHARPGTWSLADYLERVQYHYRSHWLIAFRRKRMMAWATLLTLGGVVCAAVHLLGQFL